MGTPQNSNQRGVRADFLLNFSTTQRETIVGGGSGGSSRGGGGGAGARGGHSQHSRHSQWGGGGGGGRAHPGPARKTVRRNVYRKELFLQANFRFLVADWADLKGSATDPDHMVDWDDVILVEAGRARATS